MVQSCTNVNSNRISYRYISHEISNYSKTYNVPMIEKINEHKPKRHVHFFPQPSRGPFEALPLAQQGAERALLWARFGPFCAQCGLAQKGPEWSRGPKRTGPQSGNPSWPQLPTQLGPIRGPHGNAARVITEPCVYISPANRNQQGWVTSVCMYLTPAVNSPATVLVPLAQ